MLKRVTGVAAMFSLVCGLSCKIPDPPSSVAYEPPDYIRLTEIAVRNESEATYLEIEVHLFDAADNTFMACTGTDDGMQRVDVSDSLYHVKAFFRTPYGLLTYEAVKDRQIYIVVIEDDIDQCPALPQFTGPPLTNVDDFVGRSRPFPGDILSAPQVFRFDDVTHLKMVNSPAP